MGSYPTVSPLPTKWSAVCFLWHCPRSFLHRALPGILPCGARTFLPTPRMRASGDCLVYLLGADRPTTRSVRQATTRSVQRAPVGSDPTRPGGRTQAENDEPQPQVLVTLGLPNLKPEP